VLHFVARAAFGDRSRNLFGGRYLNDLREATDWHRRASIEQLGVLLTAETPPSAASFVATRLFVACRILSPERFLATEVVICTEATYITWAKRQIGVVVRWSINCVPFVGPDGWKGAERS
jgi:hypothetical protein